MYLAGIDIGSTSISCVLTDAERGGIVRVASKANDTQIAGSRPWEQLQDPDRICFHVKELLLECCAACEGRIAAIGISCQMHGILYVDTEGNALGPLYTWQDKRADEPWQEGVSYAERLGQLTGSRLFAGYGMATHFYQTHQGAVPEKAARLCSIGDYAAMRLCGLSEPMTDASNAASFGLFSLQERDFDRSAMEEAGLEVRLLPRLAEQCGPVMGRTSILPEQSDAGIPVICAIGDNQASFLGCVPRMERTMLLNIGTGSQVSIYAEQPSVRWPQEARPFPGGGYLLVGASLGGGKTYALLEQFLRETCLRFSTFDGHSLYDEMNRLAQQTFETGEDPPMVGTQFFGTRSDPGAGGFIRNLTNRSFTPGHLILGVLQGIADELLQEADGFPKKLRAAIDTACGAGNGIRKNTVMQHLLQSRLNMPLRLSTAEEEAAYGAAIHGGVASGWFSDYESALTTMQRKDQDEK